MGKERKKTVVVVVVAGVVSRWWSLFRTAALIKIPLRVLFDNNNNKYTVHVVCNAYIIITTTQQYIRDYLNAGARSRLWRH